VTQLAPLRLRHVALSVHDLEACESFYVGMLGLREVWRPDADNLYLTSGSDSLALHRTSERSTGAGGALDHIGFALPDGEAVDAWHAHLSARGVAILAPPRTHRDGARSFYCRDPEGNVVQLLHEPRTVSARLGSPGESDVDGPGA
jgi:catechol 2,3-dioxygenase-like lactoylglutathione lyase family enzyme